MISNNSNIAIIGAGAIGGVTAAFIKKAGWDPVLVCKHQQTADRIKTRGIEITGIKGDHTVPVKAVKNLADLDDPQDIILLATKATDRIAAAQEMMPFVTPDATVVSLQNGICEEALAGVLGRDRIIGCVVGWGASHIGPGQLKVTSEGEFVIGNLDHQPDERLPFIQQLLNTVYPTRITENIMGELYSKLIINSCINSLGVIGGVKLGKLLANRKIRSIFSGLMREAMAVAAAMNIRVAPAGAGKLDYYQLLQGTSMLAEFRRHLTIRVIGFKYRRIKSSSLQSIERGRPTEIDFLNGYICERGREHGVSTPLNDAVRNMVGEIENQKRNMSLQNVYDPVFETI